MVVAGWEEGDGWGCPDDPAWLDPCAAAVPPAPVPPPASLPEAGPLASVAGVSGSSSMREEE